MNQETLDYKLKLVQLDIKGWDEINKDDFGQDPASFGMSHLCEPCKVFHNNGKCKLSEFNKCPYYEYSGKKCPNRESYKTWVRHHEICHSKDELRFKSCEICDKYWNLELKFLKDVEKYLINKISNTSNLNVAKAYLKSKL